MVGITPWASVGFVGPQESLGACWRSPRCSRRGWRPRAPSTRTAGAGPAPPVRASLPLRRCLPSPWSTTITSRGRHRTARGAPSSPAASHELHHEQHQVVGPRLGPRSLVVAPCAPPARSRAVAWLLLEFPSCTPPPALAGCASPTGLRA